MGELNIIMAFVGLGFAVIHSFESNEDFKVFWIVGALILFTAAVALPITTTISTNSTLTIPAQCTYTNTIITNVSAQCIYDQNSYVNTIYKAGIPYTIYLNDNDILTTDPTFTPTVPDLAIGANWTSLGEESNETIICPRTTQQSNTVTCTPDTTQTSTNVTKNSQDNSTEVAIMGIIILAFAITLLREMSKRATSEFNRKN